MGFTFFLQELNIEDFLHLTINFQIRSLALIITLIQQISHLPY
jgi:hypothetical protein